MPKPLFTAPKAAIYAKDGLQDGRPAAWGAANR